MSRPKGISSHRKGIRTGFEKMCLYCEKSFYDFPSGKRKFCSKICNSKHKIGIKRPNHSIIMKKLHKKGIYKNSYKFLKGELNIAKLPYIRKKLSKHALKNNSMFLPGVKEKHKNSRLLQKNTWETSIEKKVQNILKENNIPFIKHKPITNIKHKYQCDIFIEPNLVIEADGDYWHNLPKAIEKDKIRNKELKEAGYKVLRFWESEINNNLDDCFYRIKEEIK